MSPKRTHLALPAAASWPEAEQSGRLQQQKSLCLSNRLAGRIHPEHQHHHSSLLRPPSDRLLLITACFSVSRQPRTSVRNPPHLQAIDIIYPNLLTNVDNKTPNNTTKSATM
ncbi:hypothetical protein CsSME_00040066 [Camellia sinensis var. sinensis]